MINTINYSQENEIKFFLYVPYPPYSPGLAPSDFYLFVKLKRRMINLDFDYAESLFE